MLKSLLCIYMTTVLLLSGVGLASEKSSHHQAQKSSQVPDGFMGIGKKKHTEDGVWNRIYRAFIDFKVKVDELAYIDQQNEILKARIAELEIENAMIRRELDEESEKHRVQLIKEHAKTEGGVESARTIASLKKYDEEFLSKPPKVVFENAMKLFNSDKYEASARAFMLLAENEENKTYKTSQVFFLLGVSLYKVNNYLKAQAYLEKSYQMALDKKDSQISYAPRALSWIALCQNKLGDKKSEKNTIQKLIHTYPKSKEARRLNRHG